MAQVDVGVHSRGWPRHARASSGEGAGLVSCGNILVKSVLAVLLSHCLLDLVYGVDDGVLLS